MPRPASRPGNGSQAFVRPSQTTQALSGALRQDAFQSVTVTSDPQGRSLGAQTTAIRGHCEHARTADWHPFPTPVQRRRKFCGHLHYLVTWLPVLMTSPRSAHVPCGLARKHSWGGSDMWGQSGLSQSASKSVRDAAPPHSQQAQRPVPSANLRRHPYTAQTPAALEAACARLRRTHWRPATDSSAGCSAEEMRCYSRRA